MKRPDLPVYYYHDHFLEMLSFVRTTYGPILTDEHDAFVLRFQALSKDAQCLLIRMVNRRGAIFNRTFFRPSQNPQGGGLRRLRRTRGRFSAEIAESFMRFMGDGIFVARNVNFDYGFMSHEYERLERRFRFPKLCTVAGMRRRYPGHKSYGLGKLCEHYGIELETHHRALCDARATGHLLNLMNFKREGCAPDREEAA